MSEPCRDHLITAAALTSAVLFLYSGGGKIIAHDQFVLTLYRSPIIPYSAIPILAILLPLLEVLTVILLATQSTREKGFYASFILMFLYTCYLILLRINYPGFSCSCGKLIEFLSLGQHIALNVLFVAISILGIALLHYKPPLGGGAAGR